MWILFTYENLRELLDLRAHKCFWNAPQGLPQYKDTVLLVEEFPLR